MRAELILETLMTLAAIVLYLRLPGIRQSAISRWGLPFFLLLLCAMTWTQLSETEAPPVNALTMSWILLPLVLSAIPYFLDRRRVAMTNAGAPLNS